MTPAWKDLAAWAAAIAAAHFYYASEHGVSLLSCMAAVYWWVDYARSLHAVKRARGLA